MKTPKYNLKSAREWRKRKLAEGWKFYSIFAPAEIVEKVKRYYKRFGVDKRS